MKQTTSPFQRRRKTGIPGAAIAILILMAFLAWALFFSNVQRTKPPAPTPETRSTGVENET